MSWKLTRSTKKTRRLTPATTPFATAIGFVKEVSRTEITISLRDFERKRATLPIQPETEICRGACANDATVLKPGDLVVLCAFIENETLLRVLYINANSDAGEMLIDSVEDNVVKGRRYLDGTPVTLSVESYTVVEAQDGKSERGSAAALRAGDLLHYTATADSPDAVELWGGIVRQMQSPYVGVNP